jgi:hypothetical protein
MPNTNKAIVQAALKAAGLTRNPIRATVQVQDAGQFDVLAINYRDHGQRIADAMRAEFGDAAVSWPGHNLYAVIVTLRAG